MIAVPTGAAEIRLPPVPTGDPTALHFPVVQQHKHATQNYCTFRAMSRAAIIAISRYRVTIAACRDKRTMISRYRDVEKVATISPNRRIDNSLIHDPYNILDYRLD